MYKCRKVRKGEVWVKDHDRNMYAVNTLSEELGKPHPKDLRFSAR